MSGFVETASIANTGPADTAMGNVGSLRPIRRNGMQCFAA